jgi:hypothetical protein
MHLRQKEYEARDMQARWLSAEHAKHAYEYALSFSSKKRYGLNEETVSSIDRLVIESYSVADQWLKSRINSEGTLQIVYSDTEACVVKTGRFLQNWKGLFVPSRDDAVVLNNLERTILFYCHEEELEIGQRNQ